ncbi:hypothetical protein CHARACLAT_032036 [Characodon lateralis]|uniref:Uncharacterized protein n=1 Tax=Characodon lateralis TaxID=208331 RepID=A0ABU7DFH4_9TELE|nr:hypothetical protein [Characodon lateralis]
MGSRTAERFLCETLTRLIQTFVSELQHSGHKGEPGPIRHTWRCSGPTFTFRHHPSADLHEDQPAFQSLLVLTESQRLVYLDFHTSDMENSSYHTENIKLDPRNETNYSEAKEQLSQNQQGGCREQNRNPQTCTGIQTSPKRQRETQKFRN